MPPRCAPRSSKPLSERRQVSSAAMAKLSVGDAFPDITLEAREGDVSLAERWRDGPLVVAFMRHFG